jgi:hypothetical protein
MVSPLDSAQAPVAKLLDAANANDTEAFLAMFVDGAAVDDWGREFVGTDAIRGWSDREFIGKHVRIFGPLLGEFAFEPAGGLADFDHVAVGVSHVAADLGAAIDRRRHELGPLRAPLLKARLDVCDAQVHEAGHRVLGLAVDD